MKTDKEALLAIACVLMCSGVFAQCIHYTFFKVTFSLLFMAFICNYSDHNDHQVKHRNLMQEYSWTDEVKYFFNYLFAIKRVACKKWKF